jgi:lysophospholipase L1-like esterase
MKKYIRILIALMLVLPALSLSSPQKKNIMVIGDSISLGYGPFLSEMISSDYNYSTKNTGADAGNLDYPSGPNAGDSKMVLSYLKDLFKQKQKIDLILLNCGLHDIKSNKITGEKAIPAEIYRQNLDLIFKLLKKQNVPFIWVNCTPVNDSIHNSKNVAFFRYNADVLKYNQISDSICKKRHIQQIDLYSFTSMFPVNAYKDHVHYTDEYAKLQASYIAGFLSNNKK